MFSTVACAELKVAHEKNDCDKNHVVSKLNSEKEMKTAFPISHHQSSEVKTITILLHQFTITSEVVK